MRKLLLGDEAIAQAAIDSGLSGVYAYPGTPSTEITEFIQLREEKRGDAENKICCRWATNEKTAMEGALGMSYMGKRALVCMKHVSCRKPPAVMRARRWASTQTYHRSESPARSVMSA